MCTTARVFKNHWHSIKTRAPVLRIMCEREIVQVFFHLYTMHPTNINTRHFSIWKTCEHGYFIRKTCYKQISIISQGWRYHSSWRIRVSWSVSGKIKYTHFPSYQPDSHQGIYKIYEHSNIFLPLFQREISRNNRIFCGNFKILSAVDAYLFSSLLWWIWSTILLRQVF